MPMPPMIRLDAGHDRSGNPRRCFVLFGPAMVIRAVYDEGYRGYHAVPSNMLRAAMDAPTFSTTPDEYRHLVKMFKGKEE